MAKIRMIKSENGSPNGINVLRYDAGETYDIPDPLAEVFVEMGVAQVVSARTVPAEGGNDEGDDLEEKEEEKKPEEVKDRPDIINTSVRAIYDELQEKPELREGLFTDRGYPRVEAVREKTKFEVTANEIRDAWDSVLEEIDKDDEKMEIWNKLFAGKG